MKDSVRRTPAKLAQLNWAQATMMEISRCRLERVSRLGWREEMERKYKHTNRSDGFRNPVKRVNSGLVIHLIVGESSRKNDVFAKGIERSWVESEESTNFLHLISVKLHIYVLIKNLLKMKFLHLKLLSFLFFALHLKAGIPGMFINRLFPNPGNLYVVPVFFH